MTGQVACRRNLWTPRVPWVEETRARGMASLRSAGWDSARNKLRHGERKWSPWNPLSAFRSRRERRLTRACGGAHSSVTCVSYSPFFNRNSGLCPELWTATVSKRHLVTWPCFNHRWPSLCVVAWGRTTHARGNHSFVHSWRGELGLLCERQKVFRNTETVLL